MNKIEIFYFGCNREAGHCLHDSQGRSVRKTPEDFPFDEKALDTLLLPPNKPQIEGRITHVHIDGWTAIAFWDRTIDRRMGSNSVFVMRGIHSVEEAKKIAEANFPTIWDRFTFFKMIP